MELLQPLRKAHLLLTAQADLHPEIDKASATAVAIFRPVMLPSAG